MLSAITETVFGVVLELVMVLLWWIILIPVVWLVSLPFILVLALFRRERYPFAVTDMLASVHCFWVEWGIMMIP